MCSRSVGHERRAREHRTAQPVARRIQRCAQLARVLDLRAGAFAREAAQYEAARITAERGGGGKILLDAARQADRAVAARVEAPVALCLAFALRDRGEVVPSAQPVRVAAGAHEVVEPQV